MQRRHDLDALRGLMLVLMTLTHLPTRFADPLGQPLGYVSAAEGFVMLSGFMAGMIYTRRALHEGTPAMRVVLLRRALKIYGCQAALLLFLFTTVAALGALAQQSAVTDLLSFYRMRPKAAVVGGFMLIYNPPLLDILPLYVVFMLASPLLLQRGLACGWQGILGASVALWLGAQFDLGRAVYEGIVALTGLPVPFHQTGAFELFGWQFLWVLGLWLGANQAAASEPLRWPRWLVGLALAIAAAGLVARHAVGQTPGVAALDIDFDKWHLGPLRLIDFFALLALAMRYGPALAARLPRLRPLELLGAASLPVFCAHLVVTLLALALAGAPRSDRPLAVDLAILGVGFAALYAVALVSQRIDRHGRPALTADARR
ncbi:MAG TPA: OpgC domain-containing protein [Ideonella sp.]|nr:OpgC domain-containing protein [Ideonella sp.]